MVSNSNEKLHVLYLVEDSTSYECFSAVLLGTQRIQELSSSQMLKNYHLEWEEVNSLGPLPLDSEGTSLIHLVFLGALTPADGIKFLFPGQSLATATLDEKKAQKQLMYEREVNGEDLAHLWSVPVGWEISGFHEYFASEAD